MKKNRKAILGASAAALAASGSLIGSTMVASAGQAKQPVTVTWYYPVTSSAMVPNLQQVQDAINKIAVQKIGVSIHLQPIQDYQQKMSVMLQTGQADGIVWTSNWMLPYSTQVYAHAFMPLNTLLKKDGQQLEKVIGSTFLKGVAVNGTIYGIPSIQIEVGQSLIGGEIQPSVLKSVPYPLKLQHNNALNYYTSPNIQNTAQLEKFMLALHKSNPDLDPMLLANNDPFDSSLYGYWTVLPNGWYQNNPSLPFFIKEQKTYGKTPPRISLALNAQKQFITMMHRWYTEGLINHDAGTMTMTEQQSEIATGKPVMYDTNPVPEWNPGNTNVVTGFDTLMVPLRDGPLHGAYKFLGDTSTINAISATCSHPEQALEFLQLVNTNSQVYNLLAYGIKGVDYTVTGKDSIKLTSAGQKYFGNDNWIFGDVFRGYMPFNAPGFSWKVANDMNKQAVASPSAGFNFNPQPVQTEIADMTQVANQWVQPMFNGVYPASKLDDFEKALNAAGQMKVLAEMQKQFDAWWKATH